MYVIKDNQEQKIYTFDLEGESVRTFNKMNDGNFYVGDEGFDSRYYSINGDIVKQIEESEDVITKIKFSNGEVNELINAYEVSNF